MEFRGRVAWSIMMMMMEMMIIKPNRHTNKYIIYTYKLKNIYHLGFCNYLALGQFQK